eukprot:g7936.t1
MWIWRTLTTTDEELLTSSGLDALMFVKTFGLGMQLFFPLTIIGVAILIPIHKEEDYCADEKSKITDAFLRLTISNIKPRTAVFWAHFIFVYLFIFYALFLLNHHQKRFIALRHRYLISGEHQIVETDDDSETHHDHHETDCEAFGYVDTVRNWLSNALNHLLVDADEESSTAGALSMLASRHKSHRTKLLEAFHRTGSLKPSSISFKSEPVVLRHSAKNFDGLSYRRALRRNRKSSSDQVGDEFTFNTPTNAESSTEIGCSTWVGSPQASTSGALQGESAFKLTQSHQPLISDQHGETQSAANEEISNSSILKWWVLTDNVSEIHKAETSKIRTPGVELSRPSVRFLKNVTITDNESPNHETVVCAQMYCALLTNFPNIQEDENTQKMCIERWISKAYQLTFGRLVDMVKTRLEIHEKMDKRREKFHMTRDNIRPLLSDTDRDSISLQSENLIELEKHLICDTFKAFFKDEFVQATPIRNHKEVDLLLAKWDKAMGILERYEYYNNQHSTRRKFRPSKWWSILTGYYYGVDEPVDAVDYYKDKIKLLEEEISEKKKQVLQQTHASSWLLIFKTQKAASIASQVLLHTENRNQFRVGPAPGPDEMNWQSLWKSKSEKDLRQILVIPFIVSLISFPLGIFAGALSRLDNFFCDNSSDETHWDAYCSLGSTKSLITAWLPALLVSIWQNVVMPNALYYLVQASCGCDSLSQLERRIAHLLFWWDTGNIFFGAMLGGSVFYKINAAVNRPQDIVELLGVSVPASSNFFVNYVTLRAFFLLPYRLLIPHMGIWYYVFTLGGSFGFGNTARDRAILWAPRSVRYGREYGSLLLMFLISIAYSIVSPVILPITFAFFCLAWLIWRYQMLYVFVRKYESGGRMWPLMVNRLIFILWIFQIFTSCVLATKEAYWQAAILWVSVPIILRRFQMYCTSRLKPRMMNVPLEMTHLSPSADIDPEVYAPPALRQNCVTWHPEYMKAWEGWKSAAYTI